jgi:hypothetical protein
MRRSAFKLVPNSGAVEALLLMADPQRWVTGAKTSIRTGGQKLCYENA